VTGPQPHFGLTAEQLELQTEARRFAVEELRPRAAAMEWEPEAGRRVAWDLVEEASRRGWRTIGLAREDGGGGASALDLCVLVEELAYGDMGFAVILDQTIKVQRILGRLATGEARRGFLERFLPDPRCVLAICFTEPETSSDYMIPSPDLRFRTVAERRAGPSTTPPFASGRSSWSPGALWARPTGAMRAPARS
jgi:acyl-CoA dehydrogenase